MNTYWKGWILVAALAGCWNQEESNPPPEPETLEAMTVFDEYGADDVALSADELTLVTCSKRSMRILDAETLGVLHAHTSQADSNGALYANAFCRAAIIGNAAYFYWGDRPEVLRVIKQSLITRDEVWNQWLKVPEESGGLYEVVSPNHKQGYQGIVPTGVANRALFIFGLNKVYPANAEWSGIEPLYLDLATGELSREPAYFLAGVETVDIIGAFGGSKIFGNLTYHSAEGAAPDTRGFILDLETKDYQETPPYGYALSRFVDEPNGVLLSVEFGLRVAALATGEILVGPKHNAGMNLDVVPAGAGRALVSYPSYEGKATFHLLDFSTGELAGKGYLTDPYGHDSGVVGMAVNQARDRVWLATADSISIVEIPPADAGAGE